MLEERVDRPIRSFGLELIPAIRDYLAKADGAAIAAAVARGEPQTFVVGNQQLANQPVDLLVESSAAEGFACAEENGYLVGLDTTLDDALRREGVARELVRAVQDARKQAGLEVADRIVLFVEGDAAVLAALEGAALNQRQGGGRDGIRRLCGERRAAAQGGCKTERDQ